MMCSFTQIKPHLKRFVKLLVIWGGMEWTGVDLSPTWLLPAPDPCGWE
jgi:hypothetical protein